MDIVVKVVNFLSVHCFLKLVFAVRNPGKEFEQKYKYCFAIVDEKIRLHRTNFASYRIGP